MILYFVFFIIFLIVIAYFYYQVKIKNNHNYPVVFAMGLAIFLIIGNKSLGWFIENINILFHQNFSIPKQLSTYEISIFFLLLYGLAALYYKTKFGQITQKNTLFSFFQFGNNTQNNKR